MNDIDQGANIGPPVDKISINEAAANGIDRLRLNIWSTKEHHIQIDIVDGSPGPCIHVFSPFNTQRSGRDPRDIVAEDLDHDAKVFVPYRGPLPESDEYKKKAAEYAEKYGKNKPFDQPVTKK